MKTTILTILLGALLLGSGCSRQAGEVEIRYEQFTLDNGLEVIFHQDHSDPIVAVAIQFHVGSGRESPGKTGFAHLFEHFMFTRSENVEFGLFDQLIQNAGGMSNAGTGNDATTYFEVVSKNALEKVLWLESDRMGFLANAINKKALNIQQNVVQNEKRQYEDNAPYGFNEWVIAKNLFPEGHPYNWTVIGEMEDLFNATVDDAREFHGRFYVPNNATLVIAGDFDPVETRKLVEKYFGEIPRGADIRDPEPMPVVLEGTKRLVHEDHFATTGMLTMVWPIVEQYHPDSYALDYLAQLLAEGKKAPLYKVIEKERKLASSPSAYSSTMEVAGTFTITVTANEGISLKELEDAVFESLDRFERDGFTDADVERIKAGLETGFYNGISSVLGKAFRLAQYNEFAGSPAYYRTDLENMKAVTREDILRVYNRYIKDKPFVQTSFVPKASPELAVPGSLPAGVKEEDILTATEVEIDESADEAVVKTPTSFDRTVIPADGPQPVVNVPTVWKKQLSNGLGVWGIEHNELPLVNFTIVLKGGHYLDQPGKAGTAALMASLMNQGTRNRTPQELEEAIEALGSSIRISGQSTSVTLSANCLLRNYEATLDLAREMLLEPRWDEEEFDLAKTRVLNQLKQQLASPAALARESFNQRIYGYDHILGTNTIGSLGTVDQITLDDLQAYYLANIKPSVANFHIAGQINQERTVRSLTKLVDQWPTGTVQFPEYPLPEPLEKSKVVFVDFPGAKQSVIQIGYLALARTDPDFFPATVMNDHLGGNFLSLVNQVLREQKGFTYGAGTSFSGSYIQGPFLASSMVRSSATLESMQIFKSLMESYRDGISEGNLANTINYLVNSYTQRFETLRALTGMLGDISLFSLPVDYVMAEQETIRNMTVERHRELAGKYIDPSRMYYVVVGDAATQAVQLKALGFGDPEIVKAR